MHAVGRSTTDSDEQRLWSSSWGLDFESRSRDAAFSPEIVASGDAGHFYG
jgi:hypothetical protein